jgi:hypothetical protein
MVALSSAVTALAIIGLVVGFVVLLVVIWLLQNTLRPLLAIKADVTNALTAPMLKNGVPGTDQLGTTRRLADSVPDLALRYLQKLGANPAAPPPAPAPMAAAPPPPPAAAPVPAAAGSSWNPPDYHRWRR